MGRVLIALQDKRVQINTAQELWLEWMYPLSPGCGWIMLTRVLLDIGLPFHKLLARAIDNVPAEFASPLVWI